MLKELLKNVSLDAANNKKDVLRGVVAAIETSDYTVVDIDENRPWGGFFRFKLTDADRFLAEFFPGLDPLQAKLGNESAELSPKILVVSPDQRLSWQYHNRRAETWCFLTDGAYMRSTSDEQTEPKKAQSSEVVSFSCQERHRLIGLPGSYALVAEIWQHTDAQHLSDESDIVRVQDDYSR